LKEHSSDREKSVGVPFSDLVDPDIVTRGNGPASRIDPFWTMLWPDANGGPSISWRSQGAEEAIEQAGLKMATRFDNGRTVKEARALLNKRPSRIATLATINLWRTITGPQLAAMRGRLVLATPYSPQKGNDLMMLYDAGLIQRGRVFYDGQLLEGYPEIFRPDPSLIDDELLDLRYAQWMAVTMGGAQVRGHQYDRHNLLTTELSLRAAEMCPLRSVMGEAASSWSRVVGPTVKVNPRLIGDAVWVRGDGLKIVIEMTASLSYSTLKKIDQIADVLARDTNRSAVCLIVAAPPPNISDAAFARRLRQGIKKSAHSSMTRVMADVESRMLLVRWENWFPEAGMGSREFTRLAARRFSSKKDDWITVNLLDPFDVTYDAFDDATNQAIFRQLNDVLGAPHWMQREEGIDWDRLVIERAGFRVFEKD
jgi:hypothetical protein